MFQRSDAGRSGGSGRRRLPAVAAVVAVSCSLSLGAGGVAHADVPTTDPFDDPYAFRTVVPDGIQRGIADKAHLVTYCRTEGTGLNCNGGRANTVAYEVSAQFGATGEDISATLGISRTESVTVTAGCTTDKAQQGFVLVTYPSVTRHFFHVVADNTRPDYVAQGPDGYSTDYEPGSVKASPQLWTDTPDGGVVCVKEPENRPPWNSILRQSN